MSRIRFGLNHISNPEPAFSSTQGKMKSTVGNSSSAVGKNSAWYWVPDGSECYVPGKVIPEVEDASKVPVDAEKKSM